MDWIDRMNRALGYVEEHLKDELSLEKIAHKANSSSFHFQRMFSMLSGITLADYIRRRRLTLAAGDISKGADILETALNYGYESQASFTRAFSRLFGFPPGAAREPGMKLKAYPPLSFKLSIQGVHSMDYEIRSMEGFTIAGECRKFTTRDGENFIKIPLFWKEMSENTGKMESIMKLAAPQGRLKGSCLGVCMEMDEDQESFQYMIGMEPRKDADLGKLEVRDVPAMTWVVFPGHGEMPQAMQAVWKRIFGEWFPATDYEHEDAPEIEVYLPETEPDIKCPFEIWIPVKKKS